jgi:riboflavin transporter FmnP
MRQKGRTMTELRAENTVKRNEGTAGKAGSGSKDRVRVITVTGVLSAVAFLLQLIEIPLPMLMPTFIKFDFSDLPALIGSFALGPVCGIVIELIKNVLHALLATGSFGVGELSNFVLGAVFVGVAGCIYRRSRSKKGALIASLAGAIVMAVISFPSNLFIVYPVYYQFMPEETILAAYQTILPGMKSVAQSLLVFNVPFTFVKGILDVAITFAVYKKISPILKGND